MASDEDLAQFVSSPVPAVQPTEDSRSRWNSALEKQQTLNPRFREALARLKEKKQRKQEVGPSLVTQPPLKTELLCSGMGLTGFDDPLFARMTDEEWMNLELIDLHSNQLSHWSHSRLALSHSLLRLDLSWNSLTSLPARCLEGCRQLTELNLSGNRLSRISTLSLTGLTQLRTLNLSHNFLTLKQRRMAGVAELARFGMLNTLLLDHNRSMKSRSKLIELVSHFEDSLRFLSFSGTLILNKISNLDSFIAENLDFVVNVNGQPVEMDHSSDTLVSDDEKSSHLDSDSESTRRIDAVLSRFREPLSKVECSEIKHGGTQTSPPLSPVAKTDDRIDFLVSKLCDVLPRQSPESKSEEMITHEQGCQNDLIWHCNQGTNTEEPSSPLKCDGQVNTDPLPTREHSSQTVVVQHHDRCSQTNAISLRMCWNVSHANVPSEEPPRMVGCAAQTDAIPEKSVCNRAQITDGSFVSAEELKACQLRCSKSEANAQRLRDGLSEMEREVKVTLTRMEGKHSSELTSLNQDIHDLKSILSETLESERHLKQAVRELNAVCARQNSAVSQLRKELGESQAESEHRAQVLFEERVQSWEEERKKREQQWEEERDAAEKRAGQRQAELEEELANHRSIHEEMMHDANQEIIRQSDRIKSLEAKAESLQRRLIDSQDEYEAVREAAESMSEELNQKVQSALRKCREKDSQLQSKQSLLDRTAESVAELEQGFKVECEKWRSERDQLLQSHSQQIRELKERHRSEQAEQRRRHESKVREMEEETRQVLTEYHKYRSSVDGFVSQINLIT